MKEEEKLGIFFSENKRMPTYEEMKDIFQVASKNTVAYKVNKLIESGFLKKSGNKISLVNNGFILKLGTVQAGFPTEAPDSTETEFMSLDDFLIERRNLTYMMEVVGESMVEAGIIEGDLILVERGKTPRRGDIVLALVDNEYTLKYLETEKGKPVLIPANKKFKKIYPDPNKLKIEAVLKAVIRKY